MIDAIYNTAAILAPDADDTLLQVAVMQAEQMICNYCNLEEVPAGLYYVAASMAVEAWNRARMASAGTDDAEVKSVSRGDTSYSFATQAESLKNVLSASGFLTDWTAQLNPFRKLRL